MNGQPITLDPITDGTTFINPVGLIFALLMCLLIVILPRRYAMVPVIALVCYMTMGMRVMVAGLNFTMLRILLLFGWTRLIVRREMEPVQFNKLDRYVVLLPIVIIIAKTLLYRDYEAFK